MADDENSSNSANDSTRTVAEELKERPPLMGRLSVTSLNFGIPTHEGAKDHVREEYGHESWRFRTLHILHDTRVQILLMLLLLFDVMVLFVEVFLLATYPPCHTIERDAISCCAVTDQDDAAAAATEEQHRLLFQRVLEGDDHGHHEDFCAEGLVPVFENEAGCDGHKWSKVHRAEEFLFGITIFILSTFMFELTVAIVALKPQIFFRQFFYLMDFVVVSVSLALELAFHYMNEETLQSVVGLLVAARVWRFIRIGHGIVEVTHKVAEKSFHALLEYAEELESLLEDHDIDIPESDTIRKLKRQAHSMEVSAHHSK